MASSVGGKSKKGRRKAHNAATGKYKRQRVRSDANRLKKAESLLSRLRTRNIRPADQASLTAKIRRIKQAA